MARDRGSEWTCKCGERFSQVWSPTYGMMPKQCAKCTAAQKTAGEIEHARQVKAARKAAKASELFVVSEEKHAPGVLMRAEIAVLRRFVCEAIGEVEYWNRVKKEIES